MGCTELPMEFTLAGIRKIISTTVLLFACVCFICIAEEREIQGEIYSPDKSLKFIAYESDGNVVLKIYTSDDKLAGSIITGMPMYKTKSASWYKDNKILVKGADMDLLVIKKGNKWVPIPANAVFSPGENMIAEVTCPDGDKKVTLTIGRPDNPFSRVWGFDVLYRIPTNIKLDELVDALSWDKNDLIELRAKDKKYYWQKQKDDTWKQVENIQGENAKYETDKKPVHNDEVK